VTDQLPQWMKEMAPQLAEIDPPFLDSLGGMMQVANRYEDALDARVRILIAMALDLASGNEEGTFGMAKAARGFGVTDAQLADAVKVCCAMAALQRLAVGSAVFGIDIEASDPLVALAPRFADTDPDFLAAAERVVEASFASGDGLSDKDKSLIALALNIAFGTVAGTTVLATRCREAGASDAELLSVLKMAFVNGTLLRLATGRAAFLS
jgi:alkylhydroperoxidase/carboxymuconolactone decarboxylase family protein YurZ